MTCGLDVVAAARGFIGVPFRHQGRRRDTGVDCAGLVILVAHELKLSEFDYRTYGRLPVADRMRQFLNAHMDCVANWQAGDVLLMTLEREPQHLAVLTAVATQDNLARIVHSHAQVGKCVEHNLDALWRSRVRGAWRFRGLVCS